MLYRICNKCGNKYKQGSRCICNPKREYKPKYKNDEGYKIYKTARWKKLSKVVRNKYNNIDIYAFYKYNRLVQSNMVHHIVPIKVDSTQAYSIDNLIPLSNKSHSEVENRYNRSDAARRECIKELRRFKMRWEGGG